MDFFFASFLRLISFKIFVRSLEATGFLRFCLERLLESSNEDKDETRI